MLSNESIMKVKYSYSVSHTRQLKYWIRQLKCWLKPLKVSAKAAAKVSMFFSVGTALLCYCEC